MSKDVRSLQTCQLPPGPSLFSKSQMKEDTTLVMDNVFLTPRWCSFFYFTFFYFTRSHSFSLSRRASASKTEAEDCSENDQNFLKNSHSSGSHRHDDRSGGGMCAWAPHGFLVWVQFSGELGSGGIDASAWHRRNGSGVSTASFWKAALMVPGVRTPIKLAY